MNPNNLYLTTDFPQDKQLEPVTGSFSVGARFAVFQPRRAEDAKNHNVGDWALPWGSYSLDNTTWYPLGVPSADTSVFPPAFQTVEVTAYCTDTQIVVQASNYTASSKTIYYALELMSRD